MDVAGTRACNRRIEVRATAYGTDLTGFVITHRRLAAQKVHLPDDLHGRLRSSAQQHRRSLQQGSDHLAGRGPASA